MASEEAPKTPMRRRTQTTCKTRLVAPEIVKQSTKSAGMLSSYPRNCQGFKITSAICELW